MPLLGLGDDAREVQVAAPEERQQMEEEISGLRDDLLIALGHGRESDLQALLADLLSDAAGALCEEASRIAALGTLGDALLDDALERAEKGQPLRGAHGIIAK